MDQEKLEDQMLHRHQHECGDHQDHAGAIRLSNPRMDEVYFLAQAKPDANSPPAENEPLCQKRELLILLKPPDPNPKLAHS